MSDTIRLDRSDVLDTSDMRRVVFMVDAERARSHAVMPDELAAIIGRLVMGQAVQRIDMAEWGIQAMRLYNLDELEREGPPGRPADTLQRPSPQLRLIASHGALAELPDPGDGGSKGS